MGKPADGNGQVALMSLSLPELCGTLVFGECRHIWGRLSPCQVKLCGSGNALWLSHTKAGGRADFETEVLLSAHPFLHVPVLKTNPEVFFNRLAHKLFSLCKPQGMVRQSRLILKTWHMQFSLHKFKGNMCWQQQYKPLMLLSFKLSPSFEKKKFSLSLVSHNKWKSLQNTTTIGKSKNYIFNSLGNGKQCRES